MADTPDKPLSEMIRPPSAAALTRLQRLSISGREMSENKARSAVLSRRPSRRKKAKGSDLGR